MCFDYVVSSLGPELVREMRDLLLRPPAENSYNTLKAELIKWTAASEQRKLQQLISGEELRDRKPTQLLRRMQQLHGDPAADATFLRELFLQRLPPNVRMVLASTTDTMDLNTLTNMADEVIEVAHPSIAAISGPPQHNLADYEHFKAEVARLTKRVASLKAEQRRCHRSRSTLFGQVSTPTSVAGLVRVFNANVQRFRNTQPLHSHPLLHQMLDLTSIT